MINESRWERFSLVQYGGFANEGLKVHSFGLTYRLAGRAFAEKKHVWHCITGEDDTRVCFRSHVAQVLNYLQM